MILWITGLPGAGKTELALQALEFLRDPSQPFRDKVIGLDGDDIRDVSIVRAGYRADDRLVFASNVLAISKLLSEQGKLVVVSMVGMFPPLFDAVAGWSELKLVYLDASLGVRDKLRPELYGDPQFRIQLGSWKAPEHADLTLFARKASERSGWFAELREALVSWRDEG